MPLAAAAEGNIVRLLRGSWNADFLDELELFPAGAHDDMCDAASLAFSKVAGDVWSEPSWDTSPGLVAKMLKNMDGDPDDDRRNRDQADDDDFEDGPSLADEILRMSF